MAPFALRVSMRLGLFAVVILVACGHPVARSPQNARTTTATTVASPAAPSITGHVFDENGKPLPLAHVTPMGPDGKALPHVPVAADGSFTLPIASAQRIVRLHVVGAGHRSQAILIAPEDGAVDVTVKLGVFAARPDIAPALVLFADKAEPLKMTKEADGTYSREVTAPDGTYGYGIIGVSSNHMVDGVEHEGYVAAKEGEDVYRPQVTVKNGHARITFDPRRAAASVATSAVFARPDSASAGLTDVQRRLDESADATDRILDRFFKSKDGPQKDAIARINAARKVELAALRRDLAAKAKAARLPIVRQASSVAYFYDETIESPTDEERELARQLLREVAVDDPLWALAKSSFRGALEAATLPASEDRQLRETFVAQQPVTAAVATFVIGQLAATKDDGERRKLATLMKSERFNGMFEQKWASTFDPDRALATGKDVVFDVKPLDAKTKTNLTPKSFAGKVVLIDLWGTWCAPCVAEIPHLQELYAKYGGEPKAGRTKRFEILSIALGNTADEVATFRKSKEHAMPWVHALAESEYLDKFAGAGQGVPLFVLIDDQGKIIAGPPDLNPRSLPDILDRALR